MKRHRKLSVILIIVFAALGCIAFIAYSCLRAEYNRQAIEQLKDSLVSRTAPRLNRSATITIDGKQHVYTTEELGEEIYYQYKGKTYEPGKENSLARLLFEENQDISPDSLDKLIQVRHSDEKITKIVKNLSDTYNSQPQNGRIDTQGRITPSRQGHVLDTEKIQSDLTGYLKRATTDNFSASYTTTKTEPRWSSDDLKKVNTVISSYSTSFNSGSPRGANIRIAASRLDNHFLLPGESLSFLDVLYDESDGKTYQKSGAIFKGEIVQAKGGGICQVSTTAYASFLFAGIIPTKRFPHSLPVSYAPMGLDAALSVGGKDLLVKNTLKSPILISARTKGNVLNIHIKSYRNALNGYRYKPRAEQISKKKAKSYLDVYRKGKKVKTIFLSKDKYE